MFAVNDKVVCVDATNQLNSTVTGGDILVKDAVYCVRDVRLEPDYCGAYGIRLVGITAGYWFDGEEAAWDVKRFRKVSEVGLPKRVSKKRKTELQKKCRAWIRQMQEEYQANKWKEASHE